MQHKETSLLLFLTLAVHCCSPGESKMHFLDYFADGKSNDEASNIVKLLNAIPAQVILVIFPKLKTKCHMSFGNPQFGEVHVKRVNETTKRFTLSISEINVSVSCPVSGTHKSDF